MVHAIIGDVCTHSYITCLVASFGCTIVSVKSLVFILVGSKLNPMELHKKEDIKTGIGALQRTAL